MLCPCVLALVKTIKSWLFFSSWTFSFLFSPSADSDRSSQSSSEPLGLGLVDHFLCSNTLDSLSSWTRGWFFLVKNHPRVRRPSGSFQSKWDLQAVSASKTSRLTIHQQMQNIYYQESAQPCLDGSWCLLCLWYVHFAISVFCLAGFTGWE